jgi:hypothetical protein
MRRTIWFSLFCLVGIALLASVRALTPFAGRNEPKIPDSFDVEDASPLAPKTDKLVDSEREFQPDKVTVKTVKIFVQPPTPEDTSSGITKERWRPTYARLRGRMHHATRHHRTPAHCLA